MVEAEKYYFDNYSHVVQVHSASLYIKAIYGALIVIRNICADIDFHCTNKVHFQGHRNIQ